MKTSKHRTLRRKVKLGNRRRRSSLTTPGPAPARRRSRTPITNKAYNTRLASKKRKLAAEVMMTRRVPRARRPARPLAYAYGHLVIEPGEILLDKYKMMCFVGSGNFGHVYKAYDLQRERYVALKVLKQDEHVSEGKIEVKILRKILRLDPGGMRLCVQMIESNDYHGNMLIAFELLGRSVYDFMRVNDFEPYSLDQVRHIIYQLCYSVEFLHKNKLTHTDVKPENIVFVDSSYTSTYNPQKDRMVRNIVNTDLRLIDLGGAILDDECHSHPVSTPNFCAPEIILKLDWGHPCDVWSIGCSMLELYFGFMLFTGHNDREELAMMESVLGKMPRQMARKTKTLHYTRGRLNWEEDTEEDLRVQLSCQPLDFYRMRSDADHCLLFNLMQKMLVFEPSERITLTDALKDPFFARLPFHQRLAEHGNN